MTDAWIAYSLFPPYPYPGFDGVVPIGGQVYRQSQNSLDLGRAFPAQLRGLLLHGRVQPRVDQGGPHRRRRHHHSRSTTSWTASCVPPTSSSVPTARSTSWSTATAPSPARPATKLVRIDHTPDGSAPVARARASTTEGAVPLTVQLDAGRAATTPTATRSPTRGTSTATAPPTRRRPPRRHTFTDPGDSTDGPHGDRPDRQDVARHRWTSTPATPPRRSTSTCRWTAPSSRRATRWPSRSPPPTIVSPSSTAPTWRCSKASATTPTCTPTSWSTAVAARC